MEDTKKDEYEAPEGQVWVCGKCGKYAKNRVDVGDVNCFFNAVLCYDNPLLPYRLVTDTRD